MEIAVFAALGMLLAILLLVWMLRYIDYRISATHLKVRLFGFPIRRVRLDQIESVSKRRGPGWAEHWWNTVRPSHRMLIVRRKRGLLRNFIITPRNRYTFKTELVRAMNRAMNRPETTPLPEDPTEWVEGETIDPNGPERNT